MKDLAMDVSAPVAQSFSALNYESVSGCWGGRAKGALQTTGGGTRSTLRKC
jgi:hypothetical protein